MNDETFDTKERSVADIIDLANTFPMLGQKRFVQYRGVGKTKDKDQARWLAYLESPSPHTTLLVYTQKLDKRTKFAKTLAKKGAIAELLPPKPRELPSWVDRLSRRHKITLTPMAQQTLIDSIGADLALLDGNLEKLSIYLHPETKANEKHVQELVLQTAGDNIFAWTDQVLENKNGEALTTLHHLLASGTPPLILVSMLARHVRMLLQTKSHLATGRPRAQLAPSLGVPPFVVHRYVEQAGRLTEDTLTRSISSLRRLDHDLKSTGHPPRMLLERAIGQMV